MIDASGMWDVGMILGCGRKVKQPQLDKQQLSPQKHVANISEESLPSLCIVKVKGFQIARFCKCNLQ